MTNTQTNTETMPVINPVNIKTIDINAKEWFDKVNGNSYFSAVINLNYGMPDANQIFLPFQYGYDNHYIDMAGKELDKLGYISLEKYSNGSTEPLWQYCDNYDSFRNEVLIVTNVATNKDEHPGYDDSIKGQYLYDFKTVSGKEVHCSLYDYELISA